MSHRSLSSREAEDEFEFVESDEELEAYLEEVAPQIGWIVIYFNSLEDHIGDFIRQLILRDPYQDERLEVFLTEMMYAAKARALLNLYGQILGATEKPNELRDLGKLLTECAARRNEYAHADWIGVRKMGYVRVKSQAGRAGVIHRYKKVDLIQLKEDVAFIRAARHTLVDFDDAVQSILWRRGDEG